MAKTLSFTDTSPQTVKIGDTTTSFTLICGNDNVATDLTNATSITVKLGNESGYLKSATVDPASLTDPTTGQVTVKFNADLLTSLTAGGYAIEVWVVDSTGTSIYPSDGSTGFTIDNNIQSTNGSTITTIAFDDFVAAMNKAASTIAKGDKGDPGPTGTVDNAGLTAAPAFVELKTQVDDSAVGTNLLTGTSADFQNSNIWIVQNTVTLSSVGLSVGDIVTLSSYLDFTNLNYGGAISFSFTDSSNAEISNVDGNVINANSSGRSIVKGTIPSNATYIVIRAWSSGRGFKYKEMKLELGSHTTDWCPNPSEILTQSDYAKIKAAIVALGGSLK